MKMQKILMSSMVLILLASSAHAAIKTLDNYDQLLDVLQQGEEVRAIISLDKCQLKTVKNQSEDPPDMTGVVARINFTIFNHYKVQTDNQGLRYAVATSYSVLTEHRNFGLVHGYARLRVFEDNTAEFFIANYDAKTFVQKTQMNYICQISDSKTQRGVLLRSVS